MAKRALMFGPAPEILVNEELVDSYADPVYRALLKPAYSVGLALSYADTVIVPLFPAVNSNILEPSTSANVNRIVVSSNILTIESATGTDVLRVANGILQVSDE